MPTTASEAAHRVIFFDIQNGWIVYILAVIALAAFVYAIYHRYRLWRVARKYCPHQPMEKDQDLRRYRFS